MAERTDGEKENTCMSKQNGKKTKCKFGIDTTHLNEQKKLLGNIIRQRSFAVHAHKNTALHHFSELSTPTCT